MCVLRLLIVVVVSVQVRTKDRTFESIAHLIEYHMSEQLPITSSDSEILLQTPVVCHHRN